MREGRLMAKWKCKECGYIYEGDELPKDFICPVCGKPADQFELIEEDGADSSKVESSSDKPANKYAGTQTEKNLMAAFAGESQARNNMTTLLPRLVRKAINRLLPSLRRQQPMNAIMLKCGSAN